MKKTKPVKIEEGSGNVFADLGLDDADELYTRGMLVVQVIKLLRPYSQKEAAKMLGVKQPEISAIMSAKISRFSQERLIDFLTKLEQTVTIEVRGHRQGEPYKQVTLAP